MTSFTMSTLPYRMRIQVHLKLAHWDSSLYERGCARVTEALTIKLTDYLCGPASVTVVSSYLGRIFLLAIRIIHRVRIIPGFRSKLRRFYFMNKPTLAFVSNLRISVRLHGCVRCHVYRKWIILGMAKMFVAKYTWVLDKVSWRYPQRSKK